MEFVQCSSAFSITRNPCRKIQHCCCFFFNLNSYLANTEANRNSLFSTKEIPQKGTFKIKTDAEHGISDPSTSHFCLSTKICYNVNSLYIYRGSSPQQLHQETKSRKKKKMLSESHIVQFSGLTWCVFAENIRNNTKKSEGTTKSLWHIWIWVYSVFCFYNSETLS